ncbi:hypothetical protein FNF27_04626 [Cafeteria roenbergensis]|uniref:C2 domain-containing protein n=1 Tax=Cafeteria roenbergensis TaxID=33653 RepID=A0A5A8E8Q4_CAFRO|nr:hypothetical protein FNF27_04626 [Cafeteria roenbergensis]
MNTKPTPHDLLRAGLALAPVAVCVGLGYAISWLGAGPVWLLVGLVLSVVLAAVLRVGSNQPVRPPTAPLAVEDVPVAERPSWLTDSTTDTGSMLNHILAGLWPYLRAYAERMIRDGMREPMTLGVLTLSLERACLGAVLPLMAESCKYDLSASEERLDLIADLVVDTAMIPPDTFARAMKGAPGQSGGEAERFEVRMLATATVAGVQLTLPVRVSRVFLRAKVRLSLSLNGEAPYMSMLAISFVTEPDLDLAIDIGPSLVTGFATGRLDSSLSLWRSLVLDAAKKQLLGMCEATGGSPMVNRVLDRGWEANGRFLVDPLHSPARPLVVGGLMLRIVRVDIDDAPGTAARHHHRVAITAGAGLARATTSTLLRTNHRIPARGPGTTDLLLALERHPHASSSDRAGDPGTATDPAELPPPVSLAEQRRAALIEAPVDAEVMLWIHGTKQMSASDPVTAAPPAPRDSLACASVPIQRIIREATGVAERVSAPFLNPSTGFSGTLTLDVAYLPTASWEAIARDRLAAVAAAAAARAADEGASALRDALLRKRIAALGSANDAASGLTSSYAGVLIVHVHSAAGLPAADMLTGLADPFVRLCICSHRDADDSEDDGSPVRESRRRTRTQSLTVTPEWRETFTLPVRRPVSSQWLRMEVWDADERPFPDELIGSAEVPLHEISGKTFFPGPVRIVQNMTAAGRREGGALSSWTIKDYSDGARSAGFMDFLPPGAPVLFALLGAYPFAHFALLLAPHARREELVRVHNALVRQLGDAVGADTNCLKVHSPHDAARFLQTYGAVILSFMSAVHWGAVTARAVKGSGVLALVASMVPAVAAWAALNTSTDVNPPVAGRDDDHTRAAVVPESIRQHLSAEPADIRFPSPNSVLAGGFVWVLLQDMMAVAAGRLPPWYVTYRLLLTVIVTSCLKLADVGMEGGDMSGAVSASVEAAIGGAEGKDGADRR